MCIFSAVGLFEFALLCSQFRTGSRLRATGAVVILSILVVCQNFMSENHLAVKFQWCRFQDLALHETLSLTLAKRQKWQIFEASFSSTHCSIRLMIARPFVCACIFSLFHYYECVHWPESSLETVERFSNEIEWKWFGAIWFAVVSACFCFFLWMGASNKFRWNILRITLQLYNCIVYSVRSTEPKAESHRWIFPNK